MKAVLKQEWKASVPRILYTSAVITLVMLGAVLLNIIAYQTRNQKISSLGVLFYFLSIVVFIAISWFAWFRGAGNIRSLLFSDTNYLMLLVPRRSFILLGGKQLVSLAEYLIYVVPAFFYILLLMPTAGLNSNFVLNNLVQDLPFDPGLSYIENIKKVFHFTFIAHTKEMFIIFLISIIGFFTFQAALNCAYTIYGAFIKMKKPNKFLILVILFLLYHIPIQVSSSNLSQKYITFSYSEWNNALMFILKLFLFGVLYFSISSYLIEKKIEI